MKNDELKVTVDKTATAPVVDAATGKTTITLQFPATLPDKRVITTLTMRRPKVNDLRAAQRQAQTDADREVTLVALLTDEKLTPEDIGELDLADYAQVQATFRSFQGL